MHDDLARHLARNAFRISRDLGDLLSLLKAQSPDAEYRDYEVAIADAIHTVNSALLDRPLADEPEIRSEIDTSIERYGRYL